MLLHFFILLVLFKSLLYFAGSFIYSLSALDKMSSSPFNWWERFKSATSSREKLISSAESVEESCKVSLFII